MKDTTFQKLSKLVKKLDSGQAEKIYRITKELMLSISASAGKIFDEIRQTKFKDGVRCPYCQTSHIVRHGKPRGKQRYKCKDCKKTFLDVSNTILIRSRNQDKWLGFIDCTLRKMSIRDTAKELKLSPSTVFYWRHKLCKAFEQIEITEFNGIVEMDETFFLYSEKGKRGVAYRKPRKRGGVSEKRGISKEQVCVLVAKDRDKNSIAKVTCLGHIDRRTLENTMGTKISDKNTLCTDDWRDFKSFAKFHQIPHYRVIAKKKQYTTIKGLYHINTVNSYHKELKDWISVFRGVSTKYLNGYVSLFNYLNSFKFELNVTNITRIFVTACLYPVTATFESIRKEPPALIYVGGDPKPKRQYYKSKKECEGQLSFA